MFRSFDDYIHLERVKSLHEQIIKLNMVSDCSVEQLTDLFAKGYTLQPPKEPMTMSELAKEMEKENE